MDKSFNDQELSDIMKEIEALEEGYEKDTSSEVLQELTEMKESEAIPLRVVEKEPDLQPVLHVPVQDHAHVQAHVPVQGHASSMSFKVHGELNLDLQFEVGGKVIAMTVSEQGLSIVMDGGMTFNVPLKDKKSA